MNRRKKREDAMVIGGVPGNGEELAWMLIDAGSDGTASERDQEPVLGKKVRNAQDDTYSLLTYFLPESRYTGDEEPDFFVGALLDAARMILSQVPFLRSHSESRVVIVGPTLETGWPSESLPARGVMILLGRLYRALYRQLSGEGIHLEIIGGGLPTTGIWEHLIRKGRRPANGRFIRRHSIPSGFFENKAA